MTVKELNEYLKNSDHNKRFKDIQAFIFRWEVVERKGKVLIENDPDDPGGETFCGLDRRSHPTFDFRKATPKDVCDEYLKVYWNKYNCERFPYSLGEAFYNCTVNCGVGRANKILATGARTAAAFLDKQEQFYARLAAAKPSSRKFLQGWKNRTEDLRNHLHL